MSTDKETTICNWFQNKISNKEVGKKRNKLKQWRVIVKTVQVASKVKLSLSCYHCHFVQYKLWQGLRNVESCEKTHRDKRSSIRNDFSWSGKAIYFSSGISKGNRLLNSGWTRTLCVIRQRKHDRSTVLHMRLVLFLLSLDTAIALNNKILQRQTEWVM